MRRTRALRVAASSAALGVGEETPLLLEAFRDLGWSAREEAWQEIQPGPEPVLVRHAWDYHLRLPEFLAWLELHEAAGTPFFNPVHHVRWNADKRYLADLAAQGVAIPATVFVPPGGPPPDARELAQRLGTDQVVVKPAVAASAWRTRRVALEDASALAGAVAEAADGCHAMVQAFLPEVAAGEWSLVWLGGSFSHAVLKTPAAGDFRVQHEHGGDLRPAEPPQSARATAERVLALAGDDLAFARVDGVMVADEFVLMELELIEPDLFLRLRPGAAEELARCVIERVTTSP